MTDQDNEKKTYLFAYSEKRKFANLKFSTFIKMPPFETESSVMYQPSFISDFDDIFNALCYTFREAHRKSYESLEGRLKMLLLANLWSDPVLIGTILQPSVADDPTVGAELQENPKIHAFLDWLPTSPDLPTAAVPIIDQVCDGIIKTNFVGSTTDPGTLTKLNAIDLKYDDTLTDNDNLNVTSSLLKEKKWKYIRALLHQYIANVIEGGSMQEPVSHLLNDMENRYAHFELQETQKVTQDRIIAEILISRTYLVDSYRSVGFFADLIEPQPLHWRYDEIMQTLGNVGAKRNVAMHYVKYISFWNRLDYLHRMFDTGINADRMLDNINPAVSVRDITTHIFLMYLLPCVATEFLGHLVTILTKLDETDSTTLSNKDKRLTAWIAIHGMLTITCVDPNISVWQTGSGRYGTFDEIINILSRWGWEEWFLTEGTSFKNTTRKSDFEFIGKEIQYVPIRNFDDLVSIHIDKVYNSQKGKAKRLVAEVKTFYDQAWQKLGGAKDKSKLSIIQNASKGVKIKPYEFKSGLPVHNDARDAMITMYRCVESIANLLRNVLKLLVYYFKALYVGQVGVTEDTIRTLTTLATSIHLGNGGGIKSFSEFVDESTQAANAIRTLNNNTLKTFTYKPDRMYKLGSGDEKFMYLLKTAANEGQFANLSVLENKWKEKLDTWEKKERKTLNFENIYQSLVYIRTEVRRQAKKLDKSWKAVQKYLASTVPTTKSKKSYFMSNDRVNKYIGDVVLYLRKFQIDMYGTGDGSYELSLGTSAPSIVVADLPYLRTK